MTVTRTIGAACFFGAVIVATSVILVSQKKKAREQRLMNCEYEHQTALGERRLSNVLVVEARSGQTTWIDACAALARESHSPALTALFVHLPTDNKEAETLFRAAQSTIRSVVRTTEENLQLAREASL